MVRSGVLTWRQTVKYLIASAVLCAVLTACTHEAKVQFESCAQAEQAGVQLPLTPGDVGYSKSLDTDGDGLACE
jgi:hypothetical protein